LPNTASMVCSLDIVWINSSILLSLLYDMNEPPTVYLWFNLCQLFGRLCQNRLFNCILTENIFKITFHTYFVNFWYSPILFSIFIPNSVTLLLFVLCFFVYLCFLFAFLKVPVYYW
jgi:hypothetical protein